MEKNQSRKQKQSKENQPRKEKTPGNQENPKQVKNNFHLTTYSSSASLFPGGGGGYTIAGLSLSGALK